MSVELTDGSMTRSWQWSVIRFQALELTAACKNRYRWNNFLGGSTVYQDDILIKLDYNAGGYVAQITA